MNIEWTLCSELMPQDVMVIARVGEEGEKSHYVNGSLVADEYKRWEHFCKVNVYWTEFTKEKWEFLNK